MKLRVAIIGCGAIAERRHAPEYAANPAIEIAAFCDPVPGRAESLAKRYGGMAFTDIDETLAMPCVDAMSVHFRLLEPAFSKRIFIETFCQIRVAQLAR